MITYILIFLIGLMIGLYFGYRVGYAGGQFEEYRKTIFGDVKKQ